MKRNKLTIALSVLLAGSLMFSSCVGSYGLVNKISSWNQSISSNKFVNALVSVAFWIVPVYELSLVLDGFIFNSIEFWSGSNPVANVGEVKQVESENGNYLVETKADGYSITKEGEEGRADFKFDKENSTWSVESNDKKFDLVKINEDGTADLFLPNGDVQKFTLDEQGVLNARMLCNNSIMYAAR